MFTKIAFLGLVALTLFGFLSMGNAGATKEASLSAKGQPVCCMKNAYCCLDHRSCCPRK